MAFLRVFRRVARSVFARLSLCGVFSTSSAAGSKWPLASTKHMMLGLSRLAMSTGRGAGGCGGRGEARSDERWGTTFGCYERCARVGDEAIVTKAE